MRFLLVAISIIFSFIFFLFYTASLWKNIFFQQSDNFFFWTSIFWQMWITPIFFLVITILLFFYFKSTLLEKKVNNKNYQLYNNNYFLYMLWTIAFYLSISIIFFIFNINYSWIIFIFSWWIWIYFISKYLFFHHKISKNFYISSNIFSIFSWYLASIIGLLYIIYINENLLFLWTLVWIWFFHIYTHVKYDNIISLLFWVITFILSLYRLIVHLFPWII